MLEAALLRPSCHFFSPHSHYFWDHFLHFWRFFAHFPCLNRQFMTPAHPKKLQKNLLLPRTVKTSPCSANLRQKPISRALNTPISSQSASGKHLRAYPERDKVRLKGQSRWLKESASKTLRKGGVRGPYLSSASRHVTTINTFYDADGHTRNKRAQGCAHAKTYILRVYLFCLINTVSENSFYMV